METSVTVPSSRSCPFSFALMAYGVPVAIGANRPEALARLRERLPPGWRPSAGDRQGRQYSLIVPRRAGFRTLYADATRLARARELDPVLDAFEADLQLHVAELAPRRVFVHAGVVGWRGRAILLPGRSMAGKSTLVAALLRAGATYYSDEYAVLDGRGRVHPYARPLTLRTETGGRDRQPPESLGTRRPKRLPALPVGLVALCRYREGARWRPRRLPGGAAALALVANTVSAQRAPARALGAIRAVVLGAPVLEGLRGEAGEAAAALLGRIGNAAGPSGRHRGPTA